MTPSEAALALTLASSFDRRTIGESDVLAWHEAIGDLDFADVKSAIVGHYRDSTEWLMPATIRTRVKGLRATRLAAVPDPIPDADPNDPPAYIRALREQRHQIADPTTRPRPVAQLVAHVATTIAQEPTP